MRFERDLRQLALHNPEQLYIEVTRPFRFSDAVQCYWFGVVENEGCWPQEKSDMAYYVGRSQELVQKPDYIALNQCLGFAVHLVQTENGQTDTSILKQGVAANILRNLAWLPGDHLVKVVESVDKLLDPANFITVRQESSGILKNAAYHRGKHTPKVIEQSVKNLILPEITERMKFDFLRVISNISGHSKDLLKRNDIRDFLISMVGVNDPDISALASTTLSNVFA